MNIVLIFLLTVLFLVLLLTMFFYLIWRKIVNRRYKLNREQWLIEHSLAIEKYLITGEEPISFKPKKEYQFEALENTFSTFISLYKQETDFNPISRLINQFFKPRYKVMLNHRRWSVRMNALYFINLFKIKSMQEDLIDHLSRKNCSVEEKLEIFLTLATFEYEGLIELLKQSKEIPSFLLSELMGRLVYQENVDEYVEGFFKIPSFLQYPLLEIIRNKNLRSEKIQLLLEQLINSDNRELRIRALKTVSTLGYISTTSIIIQLVENASKGGYWDSSQASEEKLMVAKLMGNIRHQHFIPYLIDLVSDKVYIIRSEAAKSIRKYKEGEDVLQSIIFTHPDPYARNISEEWMERNLEYD